MTVIISDASPLHYLAIIGEIDLLPKLYGQVIIPQKVQEELKRLRTPEVVKAFISSSPSWLEVRSISTPIDSSLAELDPGEQEAITLALEIGAHALLIDDIDGRDAARLLGLRIIGTLGILYDAAGQGFCDLENAFDRLQQTNFRASKKLYNYFLNLHAQRAQ
jgi:predicted nucleic acid-binding protein